MEVTGLMCRSRGRRFDSPLLQSLAEILSPYRLCVLESSPEFLTYLNAGNINQLIEPGIKFRVQDL